jgi:acyl carrier protein|tara:strand:+ start:73 stop:354 length:282 start_codon:yes stop_codon:yes gene_type:complete
MDFIELFNGVVTLAKPVSAKESYAKSLGDQLTDLDLDSLDTIMLAMYFGEIYGIEEDVMQEMQAVTVIDLQTFLDANKTRTPEDVKTELAKIK